MEAVKQNGESLQFSGEEPRADIEIVKVAVDQNPKLSQYAHKTIRKEFENKK